MVINSLEVVLTLLLCFTYINVQYTYILRISNLYTPDSVLLVSFTCHLFFFNSIPRSRLIENCMGLIACYIEIALGKVK